MTIPNTGMKLAYVFVVFFFMATKYDIFIRLGLNDLSDLTTKKSLI